MFDGKIKKEIVKTAVAKPPVAYHARWSSDEILLLKKAVYNHVFPPGSKTEKVLHDEDTMGSPGGIIIFGYEDETPIESLTGLLDRIGGLNYETIQLSNGKKAAFMSHAAARKYLPQPEEAKMYDDDNKWALSHEFTQTLQTMLDEKQRAPKTEPATAEKKQHPFIKHPGASYFGL